MSIENTTTKKLLITSGCSFTDPSFAWPYQLSKRHNFNVENVALPSQGNGLISRKLINILEKYTINYHSDDIIVGVMWSGMNRYERIIESGDEYVGPPYLEQNPTWVVYNDGTKGRWRIMSHEWTKSEDCSVHYEIFNNQISSMVQTIEHILRTQWYLDICNIKYFMSTFMNIFSDEKIMNHPEVKYLYEMVDFSKFLPIEGFYEWNRKNYPVDGFNDLKLDWHPNEFGNVKLTEEIIIPHLIKNNIIKNNII
jgi:hypothetical protein